MILFRERLWAAPWLYIATGAFVIPASLIVFAPINFVVGVITAVVLYAAIVLLLIASAPVIEVTNDELRAGRARIARSLLGSASWFDGADATAERGPRLDARAWLLIRGWVKPVVRVEVLDVDDPAPYWLLSSRRPAELVHALSTRAGDERPPAREQNSED
jgi:hypothetical protein